MSTAHDALRASAIVRNMDEAGALAALMLGWGFSHWLVAQVITAIGNDTYLSGDPAGAYTRYLMAAAYRELLAGEPPARQIPRSPGAYLPIIGAISRIRQDRFNCPLAPVYAAFGYFLPARTRSLTPLAGWRNYVDAAAVRQETRGES